MSASLSYASALHQMIHSQDGGSQEDGKKLLQELKEWHSLLNDFPKLRLACFTPLTSHSDKKRLIESLSHRMKHSALTLRFILLLAEKKRMGDLESIIEDFRHLQIEKSGGLLGLLISAHPMSPAELVSLSEIFSQKVGKKVIFEERVDPSLLAGLQITLQGVTYDGSLRSQLQNLRHQFMQ